MDEKLFIHARPCRRILLTEQQLPGTLRWHKMHRRVFINCDGEFRHIFQCNFPGSLLPASLGIIERSQSLFHFDKPTALLYLPKEANRIGLAICVHLNMSPGRIELQLA